MGSASATEVKMNLGTRLSAQRAWRRVLLRKKPKRHTNVARTASLCKSLKRWRARMRYALSSPLLGYKNARGALGQAGRKHAHGHPIREPEAQCRPTPRMAPNPAFTALPLAFTTLWQLDILRNRQQPLTQRHSYNSVL